MEKLLSLLKDGRSRPVEMIASDLGTSVEDVRRKIEFLERSGIIRRLPSASGGHGGGCAGCTSRQDKSNREGTFPGCSGCSAGCTGGHCGTAQGAACSSCMPEGGFRNMGTVWEVVG